MDIEASVTSTALGKLWHAWSIFGASPDHFQDSIDIIFHMISLKYFCFQVLRRKHRAPTLTYACNCGETQRRTTTSARRGPCMVNVRSISLNYFWFKVLRQKHGRPAAMVVRPNVAQKGYLSQVSIVCTRASMHVHAYAFPACAKYWLRIYCATLAAQARHNMIAMHTTLEPDSSSSQRM